MTVRAGVLAGVVLVAAAVSACTSGSSPDKSSASLSTAVRTSATSSSSTPVYVAMPGLDGSSLIAKFKARLGAGATELRSTGDVPTGQQSVFLNSAKKLAGPGDFSVNVGVHEESTVYRVACDDNRATLGTVPANVAACADLRLPGVDNARVRSWVAAHHAGGKATTLHLARASYYFVYDNEKTMTLIVSYLGTAG